MNQRLSLACHVLCLVVVCTACGTTTGLEPASPCPQTFEFGNEGCARILVLVEGPDEPWPAAYRWSIRAQSPHPLVQDGGMGTDPRDGQVLLTVTLMAGLPATFGDTASFWIVAKLLDDRRPIQVGVPLNVFASDSVLRVARFAPVHQDPIVDTVRLVLTRSDIAR